MFSLRDHIIAQAPGIEERQLREHIDFVHKTLLVNPDLDIRRYRIDRHGVRSNG